MNRYDPNILKYDPNYDFRNDGSDVAEVGDNDSITINNTEHNLLIISSADRNYLNNETTFNYNVEFAPKISTSEKRAFFIKNFKNIRSISVVNVYIPNYYLDVKHLHGLVSNTIISNSETADSISIHLPRLNDLPYITLKISDIGSNVDGTNKYLNHATCMLTIDDFKDSTNNSSGGYIYKADSTNVSIGNKGNTIISGTDKKMLTFKNVTDWEKIYYPSPKANLNGFQISFHDPNGKQLSLLDDFLTISSFVKNSNKIKVTMTEYFSPEEYRVGDTIIFRNVVVSTTGTISTTQFQNFINREEGHTIIGHDTVNSDTKLYKDIYIGYPYTITKSDGSASKDEFGMAGTTYNVSSGTCINHSMQNTICIKVASERYNYNSNDVRLI